MRMLRLTVGLIVAFAAVLGVMYASNATPRTPPISAAEAANPTQPYVVKLHGRRDFAEYRAAIDAALAGAGGTSGGR